MTWTIAERPGSVKTVSATLRAVPHNCDTDTGEVKNGSIIGIITGHDPQVSKTLDVLSNLVLGKYANKAISVQDHLIEQQALATRSGAVLEVRA